MVGFVVGTQLLSLLYVAVRPQVDPWWIKYGVITEEQFNFSNTQNVIVLVVDTFQSSVFQEITDADQELKVALDGFVYFRRASGIFPYTNLLSRHF